MGRRSRLRWKTAAALATVLLSSAGSLAHASCSEVYLDSGAGYFGSSSRVIAGYGAGLGYRYYLSNHVALYGEAKWLGYLGNAETAALGAWYEFELGIWHPALGGQVTAFFGDQVLVVSQDHPDPPSPFVMALQARLLLLRFVRADVTASVLGLDIGAGWERGSAAPAVTVSVLEMGYRF